MLGCIRMKRLGRMKSREISEEEIEKEQQKRYPHDLLLFKNAWEEDSARAPLIFKISKENLKKLKEGNKEVKNYIETEIGESLGSGHYILGVQDNGGGNCMEIGTVELKVVVKSVKGTWKRSKKKPPKKQEPINTSEASSPINTSVSSQEKEGSNSTLKEDHEREKICKDEELSDMEEKRAKIKAVILEYKKDNPAKFGPTYSEIQSVVDWYNTKKILAKWLAENGELKRMSVQGYLSKWSERYAIETAGQPIETQEKKEVKTEEEPVNQLIRKGKGEITLSEKQ